MIGERLCCGASNMTMRSAWLLAHTTDLARGILGLFVTHPRGPQPHRESPDCSIPLSDRTWTHQRSKASAPGAAQRPTSRLGRQILGIKHSELLLPHSGRSRAQPATSDAVPSESDSQSSSTTLSRPHKGQPAGRHTIGLKLRECCPKSLCRRTSPIAGRLQRLRKRPSNPAHATTNPRNYFRARSTTLLEMPRERRKTGPCQLTKFGSAWQHPHFDTEVSTPGMHALRTT